VLKAEITSLKQEQGLLPPERSPDPSLRAQRGNP